LSNEDVWIYVGLHQTVSNLTPYTLFCFFLKLLRNGKVAGFEPPYLAFTFLLMFCEKNYIHYGTDHKTNVKIEGVQLDSRMPICMGDHKAKIHGGPNFICIELGKGITCTSNLVVRVILAQNLNNRWNQPITYALWLLSSVKWNYTTMEREALAMVYALHKFCHYFLNNRFVFYVDHTWHWPTSSTNHNFLAEYWNGYSCFWI